MSDTPSPDPTSPSAFPPPADPASAADPAPPAAPAPDALLPDPTPDGPAEPGSAAPRAAARRRGPRFVYAVADLEREVRTGRPGFHFERVQRLRQRVEADTSAEDRDAVLARLAALETEIAAARAATRGRKEELVRLAEEKRGSTDWKATAEALKGLQEEWKKLGTAGRAEDDSLWTRFRAPLDEFFERRSNDLAKRAAVRTGALDAKLALCEKAEALATSLDWKKTTEAFAALMEAWKAAGSAGREREQALWERFRSARAAFYERRAAHQQGLRREFAANRERKEALCGEAESLSGAGDLSAACERVKELQAEWKTVGPAPRDVHEALWLRFRAACNAVFARAHEERDRRRSQWQHSLGEARDRKRDQTAALHESIARDEAHIARWQQTLDGLRGFDDKAMEIRESHEAKIAEVTARIAAKRARIAEIEASITSISGRLKD